MVLFFAVAGSQWLASAGSLNIKRWKLFLGDRLESVPANQPTMSENLTGPVLGLASDWPVPAGLRTMREER